MFNSVHVLKDAINVWRRKAQWLASNVKFCDEYDDMDNIWRSHSYAINKVLQLEVELSNIRSTKPIFEGFGGTYEIERNLGLDFIKDPKLEVFVEPALDIETKLGFHLLEEEIPKLVFSKFETPNPWQCLLDEKEEVSDDNSLGVIRISTPKAKPANSPTIPKSTERCGFHTKDVISAKKKYPLRLKWDEKFEWEGHYFEGWENSLYESYFCDSDRLVDLGCDFGFKRPILVPSNRGHKKFLAYMNELRRLRSD